MSSVFCAVLPVLLYEWPFLGEKINVEVQLECRHVEKCLRMTTGIHKH
jgi:hypothetical protein